MQQKINMSEIRKKKLKQKSGITLVTVVITLIVPYDKMKECCNM